MKRKAYRSVMLIGAVLGAALLILMGFSRPAAAETGSFDLGVTISVQEHVAPGMAYIAKVNFSNLGSLDSPEETQVRVTLPEGVTFTGAVDQHGEALPPDETDGDVLAWNVGAVLVGDCTQHIRITLQVADDLAEGTGLPVQAEILPTDGDADPSDNTADDLSQVCDMAGSTKQVNAQTVKPGDVLTYTFQLRLAQRSGSMAQQQRTMTMTDTLSFAHQVRFLGWSGPIEGEWDGHTLRWQAQVKAGEPVTVQARFGVEGDTPPGTVLTNTARLGDGARQIQLGPATTTVELPGNAAMIGPQGHNWQPAPGLAVNVPPNAVQEMTRFEYQPRFEGELPEPPAGNLFAYRAFALNAFQFGEKHEFDQPLKLTLSLGPQELAGLKRESLQLWYRAGPGEAWARLGPPEWVDDSTMAFTTNHFTEFALFGSGGYQILLPVILR